MDNIIEQYYLDNNYPSSEKLYKMLKKDNHSITLNKVKKWLSKQETEQIMQPVKNHHQVILSHLNLMNFGI